MLLWWLRDKNHQKTETQHIMSIQHVCEVHEGGDVQEETIRNLNRKQFEFHYISFLFFS